PLQGSSSLFFGIDLQPCIEVDDFRDAADPIFESGSLSFWAHSQKGGRNLFGIGFIGAEYAAGTATRPTGDPDASDGFSVVSDDIASVVSNHVFLFIVGEAWQRFDAVSDRTEQHARRDRKF